MYDVVRDDDAGRNAGERHSLVVVKDQIAVVTHSANVKEHITASGATGSHLRAFGWLGFAKNSLACRGGTPGCREARSRTYRNSAR
jgi:hypothetical protein